MTKTKKIFTVLSCLMLLAIMSVSIFMVGCAGEDTSTIVIAKPEQNTSFNVGQKVSDSTITWDVTFTPGYDIEFDVLDDKGNKEKYGPNCGEGKTSLTLKTYSDLVKYGFTVSGFDTRTATTPTDGLNEEDFKNGVHYRVCTITYLGKQASFKYTVKAAA